MMNDRFKIRAINMETKEIIYVDNYYWFEENGITEIDNNGTASGHTGEYWINQSTGLKDKNGKLIYEADVVKYKNEVSGLCIGRIEWDNAHYELQYYTGEKYGWFSHILCLNHLKNIEVIGNIYVNPELLKECE